MQLYERAIQGSAEAKQILDAHDAHLHAAIERAFTQFPTLIVEREKIISCSFDMAENVLKSYAAINLLERSMLLREMVRASDANLANNEPEVIAAADTFLEICRQAVERLEK